MGALISTDEPARSVSGAEALQARHNEQKAEIDAREDSLVQVNKVGRKLIQQGHYASAEVRSSTLIMQDTSYSVYPSSRAKGKL